MHGELLLMCGTPLNRFHGNNSFGTLIHTAGKIPLRMRLSQCWISLASIKKIKEMSLFGVMNSIVS